ncbi:MAG: hypothetical protein MI919_31900, partial [Holophagales bacterium]|nr:hypothetical protein [Holophagales bacterium]
RVTGVTTMRMTRGLDSGPILLTAELAIGDHETTAELAPRLAARGASLMVETLDGLEAGKLVEQPQDHSSATFAPRLERHHGEVVWRLEARQIYDRWRAYTPWPGLGSRLGGEPVKLVAGRPREAKAGGAPVGTFLGLRDGAMDVACGGDTIFSIERLQRPGRKALDATDFVNGERLAAGARFEES